MKFYKKLGFVFDKIFYDEEYRWTSMKLGRISLEIFDFYNNKNDYVIDLSKIGIHHFALQVEDIKEAIEIVKDIGINSIEIYTGDLNKKSFTIKDPDGIVIQFIEI